MLCLHGGGANAHWYDFVAGDLSRDHHVIAPDFRGHGDSEWAVPPAYSYHRLAADIAELVERTDMRDFVLIGHSLGGVVGLVYAATYPGRAGSLIVVDSMLQMSGDVVAGMRAVGSHGRTYDSREDFIERFRLRPGNTSASPAMIRHLAERSGRRLEDGRWIHKFDRSSYASRDAFDGLPYWARIDIPALVMKAARSTRITPEVRSAISARCPHVQFTEVAGSDHHIMLDQPAGFVRAVRAFLGSGVE